MNKPVFAWCPKDDEYGLMIALLSRSRKAAEMAKCPGQKVVRVRITEVDKR